MRKLISVFLLVIVIAGSASAQQDSINLPLYKRFPTVAPYKLLKADSVSYFTKADLKKNRAVLLIIFSPDCEHCQHETEEIIKHMESFKKIQIVMATTWPLNKMRDFYARYDLKRFSNILMGQDVTFMLPTYYHISNMPFMAFYDKKGKLIDTAEGSLPVEKVLAKFQ
jgi:thioredoxin-related protein